MQDGCGLFVLRNLRISRGKRLERHGLTLQAPLAVLAAGSAAPLSKAEEGTIVTAVYWSRLSSHTVHVVATYLPGDRAEPSGDTRLGSSSRRASGFGLRPCACEEERSEFCHVIFAPEEHFHLPHDQNRHVENDCVHV